MKQTEQSRDDGENLNYLGGFTYSLQCQMCCRPSCHVWKRAHGIPDVFEPHQPRGPLSHFESNSVNENMNSSSTWSQWNCVFSSEGRLGLNRRLWNGFSFFFFRRPRTRSETMVRRPSCGGQREELRCVHRAHKMEREEERPKHKPHDRRNCAPNVSSLLQLSPRPNN